MKKCFAFLTVIAMLLTFASCAQTNEPAQVTDEIITEALTEESISENVVADTHVSNDTTNAIPVSESSSQTEETTSDAVDPSLWSKEEAVEFYKAAAKKTHPKAKSTQVMVLEELIFNDGDGALAFFIKILEPAIASVIKKNALDFDGITGGFEKLTADDVQNIKAYKSGEYTVIEMTMKPQTDPIHAVATEGSVGHAISVLGDISLVLAEFPQFDVDVENADIAIHYVNPTVRVKINKDGFIEKGTWKYTCDPEIRNLDISGIMIKKADAKIDYIITVGGGF